MVSNIISYPWLLVWYFDVAIAIVEVDTEGGQSWCKLK